MLYIDPNCSRGALIAALTHDWPEERTGDVPAPAKWADDMLKCSLENMEATWRGENNAPRSYATVDERKLLKMCDMLDLVLSSVEEAKLGNKEALALANRGVEYIRSMDIYTNHKAAVLNVIEEYSNERKRPASRWAALSRKANSALGLGAVQRLFSRGRD
ncbi:MAG: HD domain-containing protein [Actinobacteria bacterium]|nr:HD domain-containing protein [Actinomycetota bacterium]